MKCSAQKLSSTAVVIAFNTIIATISTQPLHPLFINLFIMQCLYNDMQQMKLTQMNGANVNIFLLLRQHHCSSGFPFIYFYHRQHHHQSYWHCRPRVTNNNLEQESGLVPTTTSLAINDEEEEDEEREQEQEKLLQVVLYVGVSLFATLILVNKKVY